MHRMKLAALTATVALGVLAGVAGQARAQGVTAYEGARVIVGDGRVLDNTTLVVDGTWYRGELVCRARAGIGVAQAASVAALAKDLPSGVIAVFVHTMPPASLRQTSQISPS